MIPFKRYCFCLLFDEEEDAVQCKCKVGSFSSFLIQINEMSMLYKNVIPIPDKSMLEGKIPPKRNQIDISLVKDVFSILHYELVPNG